MPSVCLPDTFNLAPHLLKVFYVDHRDRLRCMRPCSTRPHCPFGLVCAQIMSDTDSEHLDHLCSRCVEFRRAHEDPWGWFHAYAMPITRPC